MIAEDKWYWYNEQQKESRAWYFFNVAKRGLK